MSSQYRQVVEQLHAAVATATGRDYLRRFALALGEAFAADCAIIAVVEDEAGTRLRGVVVNEGGRLAPEELVWPLPGSPAAEVIATPEPCIFRSGLRDRFPDDPVVRRMQADSCIGVPLTATDGDTLGLIVLMGRKDISDDLLAVEIVQLFADRVVAELERLPGGGTTGGGSAQLRIRQLETDLQHARKELEDFTYAVSHDLRGPLRAINGFSESLATDYAEQLDDTAADYLRRIRNNATQMDLLLSGVLTLSRVARQVLEPGRVDLSQLCLKLVERMRRENPERRVRVSVQPGIAVYGDAALLTVAMEQLLSNAWKFTAGVDEASIVFSAQEQEGATVCRLADNGAGFNMAYADKLFGVFQRLHGQQIFEGLGAGLAIVKCVIDRHGGSVWAEGEPGKGASFYFSLPAGTAVDVHTT